MMWTEGLAASSRRGELYFWHHTVPVGVFVALVMGIVFLLLIIYPFRRSGSPATTRTTTCCSVRVTSRCAPASVRWRSRSTWC